VKVAVAKHQDHVNRTTEENQQAERERFADRARYFGRRNQLLDSNQDGEIEHAEVVNKSMVAHQFGGDDRNRERERAACPRLANCTPA